MAGEKTRWIFDDEDDTGGQPDRSSGITADFTAQETAVSDDTTRWIEDAAGDKTVGPFGMAQNDISAADAFGDNTDPVVGWLVVLRGPGKGQSVPLYHGMNVIGRNADQRVSINFGDKMISGSDHAKIIYEDREFYVAHGSGKSVTKLNGKMIPNMVELPNNAVIQLTKATTLAFVALCGADFDWEDVMSKDAS